MNVVVPFDFGINYNNQKIKSLPGRVVVPFDFGINYNENLVGYEGSTVVVPFDFGINYNGMNPALMMGGGCSSL